MQLCISMQPCLPSPIHFPRHAVSSSGYTPGRRKKQDITFRNNLSTICRHFSSFVVQSETTLLHLPKNTRKCVNLCKNWRPGIRVQIRISNMDPEPGDIFCVDSCESGSKTLADPTHLSAALRKN
jgi:hypothetical protein